MLFVKIFGQSLTTVCVGGVLYGAINEGTISGAIGATLALGVGAIMSWGIWR
jgi:hypothetical protein